MRPEREAAAYEKETQKTRQKELKERRRLEEARTFAAAYRLAREAKQKNPPDYRRVIPALEKALTLATRGSRNSVQVELAATYRKAKELREARAHYDAILDRNPDYTPALVGKAALLLDQYQPERALNITEEIPRKDPKNYYAKKVQARAWSMLGRPDEANWVYE